MLSLRELAHALGGHIEGSYVLAPGPGHSLRDRSLRVTLSRTDDGFVVHSFAGDDWKACHAYVSERLGRPQWQPGKSSKPYTPDTPITAEQARYAKARELWHGARTDDLRQHVRMIYPALFKDEAAWAEAFRMAGAQQ